MRFTKSEPPSRGKECLCSRLPTMTTDSRRLERFAELVKFNSNQTQFNSNQTKGSETRRRLFEETHPFISICTDFLSTDVLSSQLVLIFVSCPLWLRLLVSQRPLKGNPCSEERRVQTPSLRIPASLHVGPPGSRFTLGPDRAQSELVHAQTRGGGRQEVHATAGERPP